jgi:MtN3 and saliva related transmembrane protein
LPGSLYRFLELGLAARGTAERLDIGGVQGCSRPPYGTSMALLDYTGYAAALCTTSAYVPQVIRVWRTRSTKDISLKMFLVLVTGLALWLTYGFWKGEVPLIAANSITLMLASTILYFKLKHG